MTSPVDDQAARDTPAGDVELDQTDDVARPLPQINWRGVDELRRLRDLVAERDAEIERLHTWAGLMSLLDQYYPADVFMGETDEIGPRTVRLVRHLDAARAASQQVAEWRNAELAQLAERDATIARVRALHCRDEEMSAATGRDCCKGCATSVTHSRWPCKTIAALEGQEARHA